MFQGLIKKHLRKIITMGMLMVVLTSVFSIPRTTYAQTQALYDLCIANNAQNPSVCDENKPVQAPTVSNSDSGSFITNLSIGVITKIITVPLQIIMTIIAGLLGLSGIMLDWVIKLSVVDLASNLAKIPGIDVAWRLIRDLSNMSFIFVLLYYAVMMIFGQEDVKKIIVPIIIAALLINFSLFFTKVIIDASNIVTVSFYNSISKSSGTTNLVNPNSPTQVAVANSLGFSGAFMKSLNLTSLYSVSGINIANVGANPGPYVFTILGASIFMLIAAFIFLAMSILFIIRYLTFILLLILSPFGYMSSVIPGLNDISKKYWGTLLNQAYFAPIFMIMSWITLTLASSLTLVCNTASSASGGCDATSMGVAFANPSVGSIGTIVNFILLAGLMIYTMIIAKDFASKGGIVSGKIVGAATSFAGNAIFGGVGALGRNTLGRLADSRANNQDLKDRAANGNKFAQLQLKTARYGAKSTFDTRKTGVGESIAGLTGVNVGKGLPSNPKAGEKGFEQTIKNRKEIEKKYAESLKPSDEVVARAKEELKSLSKDEDFILREARNKTLHLETLDETIEKYKKEFNTDTIEAQNKALKEDRKRLSDKKSPIEDMIRELNKNLRNTPLTNVSARNSLVNEINRYTSDLTELDENITSIDKDIKKSEEALEPLNSLLKQKVNDEQNWVSDELKKNIERAGGSKANRDEVGKFGIKQGKESKDPEIIGNTKNINIENYAQNLEKPNSFRKIFGAESATATNKRAALEVRKAAKGKTPEQEAAEVLKKIQKAQKAAAGEPDEDEEVNVTPKTETPPATPSA